MNKVDLKFKVCPRCHNDWPCIDISIIQCLNCHMCYHHKYGHLFISNFLVSNDQLSFFDRYCHYSTFLNFLDGKMVNLPLLPYNITPEKLKLYLLFL